MTAGGVTLRAVAPSVLLPSLLYGLGQGAIYPVIALSALELGASAGLAGMVVGALGLGQLLADIPAGALTARVGERRARLFATVLVSAALVVCVFATAVWVLALAIGLAGVAGAVWMLAQLAYVTEAVAPHLRARVLATLGGAQRIGTFAGPFLGAGAMTLLGGTDAAYWTHVVAAIGCAILLLLVPDPTGRGRAGAPPQAVRLRDVVRQHSSVLRTLGTAMVLVGVVRSARLAVIPLWGEQLGLSPSTTALVFGLSNAVDMLLFYPAGKVMDRYGRVWMAVPAMVFMGLGLIVVPFTTGVGGLALAAALMGLGNGMSSGLVMVLGADASPSSGRAAFLSVWRLGSDAGVSGGPLLLGGVAALAGLATGVWLVGLVGAVGAAALWRWVPRTGGTSSVRAPAGVAP